MSDSEELMHDQDKIEAYDQLRARADALGYPSVNHALDALESGELPHFRVVMKPITN